MRDLGLGPGLMRRLSGMLPRAGQPAYEVVPGVPALAHWDATDQSGMTYSSGTGGQGSKVASWEDLSGNGCVLSNSDPADQPFIATNSLNGLTEVRGNPARLFLSGGPTADARDWILKPEMYVVTVGSQDPFNWGLLNTTGNDILVMRSALFRYKTAHNDRHTAIANPAVSASGYNGTASVVDLMTSGTVSNLITRTTGAITNPGTGDFGFMTDGPGNSLFVRLGEIVILDYYPTAAQKADLATYLANKWIP